MSSKKLPAFPASKIKEIITQDPDLKDIPKKGIEMLRIAAEEFARYTFNKISEETKKKGQTKMQSHHFLAAINNDPALNAILGQFIISADEDTEQPQQNADTNEETNEVQEINQEENENFENEPEEPENDGNDLLSNDEEEDYHSKNPSMHASEQVSDLENDDY